MLAYHVKIDQRKTFIGKSINGTINKTLPKLYENIPYTSDFKTQYTSFIENVNTKINTLDRGKNTPNYTLAFIEIIKKDWETLKDIVI